MYQVSNNTLVFLCINISLYLFVFEPMRIKNVYRFVIGKEFEETAPMRSESFKV